jgi:hypothetical protein
MADFIYNLRPNQPGGRILLGAALVLASAGVIIGTVWAFHKYKPTPK